MGVHGTRGDDGIVDPYIVNEAIHVPVGGGGEGGARRLVYLSNDEAVIVGV